MPASPDDLDEYDLTAFSSSVRSVMALCREIADEHGFDTTQREDGTLIALMHGELSECLECLRQGNPASDHISDFSGAEEEMADLVIRVFDMCVDRGWNLPDAIIEKMQFNSERPYRHGGKKF